MKLTDNMRDTLERIADKRPRNISGRSEHGGAATTWYALVRRGLLDKLGNITPAGLEAIGRPSGVLGTQETKESRDA